MDIDTHATNLKIGPDPTRYIKWAVAGVAVVLVGLSALFWWAGQQAQSPQGVLARQHANFALFYPSRLPDGFTFDASSVSSSSQAVTYSIVYGHTKRLNVSVQPKANLNTDSFNPTTDFATTVGHAYVVDLDDRTTAAVVGDSSWALLNAPDKISVDDLKAIINELRQL